MRRPGQRSRLHSRLVNVAKPIQSSQPHLRSKTLYLFDIPSSRLLHQARRVSTHDHFVFLAPVSLVSLFFAHKHVAASDSPSDYLGTSSNWSFTRRLLLLTHQHTFKAPLPMQALLFDGAVYDIDWDDAAEPTTAPVLPTLDHAIYLINSVKFSCGQILHLFDEEDFMSSCHRFYESPSPEVSSAGLWYVHFCLVIALGKALLARPQRGSTSPSGHNFFVSVFRRIPN